jgi:hypothetical protein
MSLPILDVMFLCPRKRIAVKSQQHTPTTYADFENWQDEQGGDQRADCSACGSTHTLLARNYFLEAAQSPA